MNNDAILKAARKRMSVAYEADKENRTAALDDMEMLSGKQWPQDIKDRREADGRPTPVINRLPRFVRQVTGDIRKLNPAIRILPADEAATPETAEVIAGIVRGIEARSDAASVYEGAAESAARCSFGAFRVLTDYESIDSFDQEIRVAPIHNPLSVYWDPQARMSTRSDARYCFITSQMSGEEFDEQYKGKTHDDASHDGTTDGLEHWHQDAEVVVAEYFWKEPVKKTIGLLRNGQVVENPTVAHDVVRTRTVETNKIMWAKISGVDVLEGPRQVPGDYIPIIAVVGEEMHIGNRVYRSSVIRYAKEPQQIYNYYAATQTETVALQPKAPYMVTPKQIAGLESIWAGANDSNRSYLVYNPDEKAPVPQRMQPPVTSSGMLNEMLRAEDDMKATTGIYDAALGGRSNEQSGIAIRQRQLESDISTSIYTDNLAKAIEQCGRVIVSMIPHVYDSPRMVRTIGEDEQEASVPVNAVGIQMDNAGHIIREETNMLASGKYDVRVTVGPNYTTRRQETAESMMQFVSAFPQAGQVAGDLIAKSMDWPDADKLAERLRKILPPGMIDPEDMDPEQQQEMAGQMQQAQEAEAIQKQGIMTELRKAEAEATEAEADAQKAQTEAAAEQLNLALQSGQLNEAIGQIVQQQVALALQGAFQPGFGPR